MLPGTLVHLTETAHLSAGIDPDLNLLGIILESVDIKSITNESEYTLSGSSGQCYRVLLGNSNIEILYREDLEEVDEENNSS